MKFKSNCETVQAKYKVKVQGWLVWVGSLCCTTALGQLRPARVVLTKPYACGTEPAWFIGFCPPCQV